MKANINTLPENTQNEIRQILRVYDSVSVEYANGRYTVLIGSALQDKYADDFRVIGYIKQSDIYTRDEIVQINFEEFGMRVR